MEALSTRVRLRVAPGATRAGCRRPPRRGVEGARRRCRPKAVARTTRSSGCSPRLSSLPRDAVTLVSGHGARDKIVELDRPRPDADRAAPVLGRREGAPLTAIDTDRFREALLEERRRVEAAIENLHAETPGSLDRRERRGDGLRQPPRRHGHGDVRPRARLHARGELRACSRGYRCGAEADRGRAPSASARTAASRSRKSGSRHGRGRPSASTASASGSGVDRARSLARRRRPGRLGDRWADADLRPRNGGSARAGPQWLSLATVAIAA